MQQRWACAFAIPSISGSLDHVMSVFGVIKETVEFNGQMQSVESICRKFIEMNVGLLCS